jgi:hypothetical protein
MCIALLFLAQQKFHRQDKVIPKSLKQFKQCKSNVMSGRVCTIIVAAEEQ